MARRGGSLRTSGLGARHGLTEAQVLARFRDQGGACFVCRRPMQDPQVDHDHRLAVVHGHAADVGCSRCFRALLCNRCNSILGFADDSTVVLLAAVDYLERWRALRPLPAGAPAPVSRTSLVVAAPCRCVDPEPYSPVSGPPRCHRCFKELRADG